jgi:hypothetical protein
MQAGDKLQASGVSSKLLGWAMPTFEYRILSPVREREPRNFDM